MCTVKKLIIQSSQTMKAPAVQNLQRKDEGGKYTRQGEEGGGACCLANKMHTMHTRQMQMLSLKCTAVKLAKATDSSYR